MGELEDKKDEVFEEALGKDYISPLPLPARIVAYLLVIFFVGFGLYFFLISISILGDAFKALAGTSAGEAFTGVSNPIAGLMVGVLATVLVQSSSTTTSIITVLVGDGLIPFPDAIPMIMGANIGTTVTNTIVAFSLAAESPASYERAFSAATVHDMFNYLNVLTFLPLELIVSAANEDGGPLALIAEAMTPEEVDQEGEKEDSFVKEWTKEIKNEIISINKDVITDYSKGRPSEDDCKDCDDTKKGCGFKFKNKKAAAKEYIYCNATTVDQAVLKEAQADFDNARLIKAGIFLEYDDTEGGIYCLLLSLFLLIGSLTIIVKSLTFVVRGPARVYVRKLLNVDELLPPVFKENKVLALINISGWISIALGAGLTFGVQSSSITTSILTPMAAADLLSLENMYPYTLGANIGTTTTSIIAALAKGSRNSLKIAYVHLMFNVLGTVIWFAPPFTRQVPVNMARFMGKCTHLSKFFPLFYIFMLFLIYPALFFGISLGFESGPGGAAAAGLVLVLVIAAHIFALYAYLKKGGRERLLELVENRRAGNLAGTQQKVTDLESI